MRGKKAQVSHGLDVQRDKGGDVVLIEGLGILSEDNITVVRGGGTRQAESIAPEILFLFVGAAISLFFIGGAFDAQAAIRIAFGLSVGVVALWDVLAQIVLFDIGIEVRHIEGDDRAIARDFLLESLDRLRKEISKQARSERAQLLVEPT